MIWHRGNLGNEELQLPADRQAILAAARLRRRLRYIDIGDVLDTAEWVQVVVMVQQELAAGRGADDGGDGWLTLDNRYESGKSRRTSRYRHSSP